MSLFTLDQIKAAHAKVQSGADFPAYIRELKELGVNHYQTFVEDGRTDYFDGENSSITSAAKYDRKQISSTANPSQFTTDLKQHQQGKTDYPTFCDDCSKSGVHKWVVDLQKMTCTYFDLNGNPVLEEAIPG